MAMEGRSLLDMLVMKSAQQTLKKEEFGKVMHDPNSTEEEIAEALKILNEAGGYENLGD